MKIIMATNNRNKVVELKKMLNIKNLKLYSSKELGVNLEIEEVGKTFEENAILKAEALYKYLNDEEITVIADDSGLCVDAIDGAPGIYSARFSGGGDNENIEKLLDLLKDVSQNKRNAHFACVIALVNKTGTKTFTGICNGRIADKKIGDNGFGYDPIFICKGLDKTFAQISSEEKNEISHRAIAVKKIKIFLEHMN